MFSSDIDECVDRVLACQGLDEICVNTEGSFHCHCAEGFIRKDNICLRKQLPSEWSLTLYIFAQRRKFIAENEAYKSLFILQMFRRKVSLRISKTMKWRCCSRCFWGWCFVLWDHLQLKGIWSTHLYSWEQQQPWQVTGSRTKGMVS